MNQQLFQAIQQQDQRKFTILMNNRVDFRTPNQFGETPLMEASRFPANRAMASQLIRSGADVNQKDQHGNTALHSAAEMGNRDVVRELLHAGANPSAQNEWGIAPLHYAATLNDHHMVSMLMQNGAFVDVQDNSRRTPLHMATKDQTVDELLSHGADLLSKDDRNQTLADIMYAKVENKAIHTDKEYEALAKRVDEQTEAIVMAQFKDTPRPQFVAQAKKPTNRWKRS